MYSPDARRIPCYFLTVLGEEVIPSTGQPRNFGAPFDRGDSDVTLRSCDCVDFHVHKAVLGIASVTFEDILQSQDQHPTDRGMSN